MDEFDVSAKQFISKTDRRNRERAFLFQERDLIRSDARGERLDEVRQVRSRRKRGRSREEGRVGYCAIREEIEGCYGGSIRDGQSTVQRLEAKTEPLACGLVYSSDDQRMPESGQVGTELTYRMRNMLQLM